MSQGRIGMRRLFLIIVTLILLAALVFPLNVEAKETPATSGQAQDILVKFKPGTSASQVALVHRLNGGQIKKIITGVDVQVVSVPAGKAIEKSKVYASNPNVIYAEPDYVAQNVEVPNDPWFGNQWGLTKIQAPAAWDVTHGSSAIKIAILDTGIDPAQLDLAGKI